LRQGRRMWPAIRPQASAGMPLDRAISGSDGASRPILRQESSPGFTSLCRQCGGRGFVQPGAIIFRLSQRHGISRSYMLRACAPGRLMRWSRHCSPPSIIPIPNGVSLWTQFRQIVVGSPLVGDRLRRRRSGHPSMLKASGMALKMCARPSREQSDASHAATTSLADQVRLL
jgi:hypothetical protein